MIYKKYGKPIGDLIKIKKDFFENNTNNLNHINHINNIYKSQPKRKICKICESNIYMKKDDKNISFKSHGINYYICKNCGHLNGEYLETEEFSNQIYIQDSYNKNYEESDINNYNNRLNSIYKPKVKFLIESLSKNNERLEDIKILDIGAGSGYFVNALINDGIEANGIEISEEQVNFGNFMINDKIKRLNVVKSNDLKNYIITSNANILSFIGAFEHIINLNEILYSIKENKNIKYIFFSVPMFSYSCIFEAFYQNGFNRQLGGAHTHLFTIESINYMLNKINFDIISQWQFGSDIMDLYRFICIELERTSNIELKDYFEEKFKNIMDNLQLVIDKSEFASEIHILAKRNNK